MNARASSLGYLIAAALLAAGGLARADEPDTKPVADFSDASAAGNWQAVNDNVMGGVSEGGIRITDEKTLLFTGTLSLENRGGFASIRTRQGEYNLGNYEGLAVRVRGDGRAYNLDLFTNVSIPAGSFRTPFQTEAGQWQELRMPFRGFRAASFGITLTGLGPPDASKIRGFGFMIADKKAGPFKLEVQWIRAYGLRAGGPAGETAAEGKDIVETAAAAGSFKTLLEAAKAAGLVEALKGKDPLTVFAPTDEAFGKLPKGVLEELLQPRNRAKLAAVLTYHVVPGRLLLAAQSPTTLEGQLLVIQTPGAFSVNGAKVLTPDIPASNGVIHVIDSVLIPPARKRSPAQEARAVIELAIERGVPLFNDGQHAACAAVYEVTLESLLRSQGEALSEADRASIEEALGKARLEKSPREQAWILRRAMDAAYKSLAGR